MKTNKQIIEALRDNAELAWAAYGFFDRGEYDDGELGYRYEDNKSQLNAKNGKEHNNITKATPPQYKITYPDILTGEYKDLRAYHNIPDNNGEYQPIKPFYKKSKFQGDMNKEQARQLLGDDKSINQIRKAKYTLIHHIPNTTISGFSATLFYDNCAKNYTLAFRGTETIRDIV